jgi:hypothetical protein
MGPRPSAGARGALRYVEGREGANRESGVKPPGGEKVKITPGKLAGMKAVSNERGVIAAAAMDQRGSLKKALAKDKGGDIGDATWKSSRPTSPKC